MCDSIGDDDIANEIDQFSALTLLLLETYGGSNKTFILEHWEGDWSARCGSYNAQIPPTPQVIENMIKWLQARQDGVELGRSIYCQLYLSGVDCDNGSAVMNAAGLYVYHGCEVNLVGMSINTTFPNLIRSVVPFVALDTVSYSSYDTMSTPVLGSALDFIMAQMNRSSASPERPVFITEWGMGIYLVTVAEAMATARNVIAYAASRPFVARVLHWQVINNELDNGTTCGSYPTFDWDIQHGYSDVLPTGALSYFGTYLQGLINGSIPIPAL